MADKQILNELALFAGAGGGILGGKLLGWRTVCAVEINTYCANVLVQRQNEGFLGPFPIWDDVRTFDGRPWRGIVDVVSGGFPCQDISAAGKGTGIEGERSGLWREMARIISEVRPRFAFVENSPMLTSRGLGRVLGDLAEMGYDSRWGVVSAYDAGAPHLRERIWIVGYKKRDLCVQNRIDKKTIPQRTNTNGFGSYREKVNEYGENELRNKQNGFFGSLGKILADSSSKGRQQKPRSTYADEKEYEGRAEIQTDKFERNGEGNTTGDLANSKIITERAGLCENEQAEQRRGRSGNGGGENDVSNSNGTGCEEQRIGITEKKKFGTVERCRWWESEPELGRVANGVAYRVDRLKAIGNGQVSRVAQIAWETLTEGL